MNIVLIQKREKYLEIQLRLGATPIDREFLTISQDFDNMLITCIDKLLARNKMDRLLVKSLKMLEKMRPETVSAMIIGAVEAGLKV